MFCVLSVFVLLLLLLFLDATPRVTVERQILGTCSDRSALQFPPYPILRLRFTSFLAIHSPFISTISSFLSAYEHDTNTREPKSSTMDPVLSGLDPTVPLESYGNSTGTGGDSRLYNLNVFYNVSVLRTQEIAKWQLWSAGLIRWFTARRYRLDDHINCSRASHDSGCRVGLEFHYLCKNLHESNQRITASSTPASHEENPHYHSYGSQ